MKSPTLPARTLQKKCNCGGNCKMRSFGEKVNSEAQLILFEARGCEPTGASWSSCVIAFNDNTAPLPAMLNQPDGRWWRIDASTADRRDIPDALLLAVANDPTCMAALRAGGHIWVREEVTNG